MQNPTRPRLRKMSPDVRRTSTGVVGPTPEAANNTDGLILRKPFGARLSGRSALSRGS